MGGWKDAVRAGFDSEALSNLAGRIQHDVDAGNIAGAVTLAVRNGRPAFLWAQGMRDVAVGACMQPDTIFWIASMTKPVCCAAALCLVDDGRLALKDPVADYLPRIADLTSVESNGVAVGRKMIILDLMRHTAGFTYGAFGDTEVHRKYMDRGVYDWGQTNSEFLTKVSSIPLLYSPGSTFEYGVSTDVLGCVVEKCSGKSLDVFIRERITEPLNMKNTGFDLGEIAPDRVARPLASEIFTMAPPVGQPSRWRSGGGGLWSTVEDYSRFVCMLLGGGVFAGRRVLNARSVAAMLSNQLPTDTAMGSYVSTLGAVAPTRQMGQGFGLGVSIRIAPDLNPFPGNVGDFCWPGTSGCNFWGDPAQRLCVVQMMHAPSRRIAYRGMLREAIYRALAS